MANFRPPRPRNFVPRRKMSGSVPMIQVDDSSWVYDKEAGALLAAEKKAKDAKREGIENCSVCGREDKEHKFSRRDGAWYCRDCPEPKVVAADAAWSAARAGLPVPELSVDGGDGQEPDDDGNFPGDLFCAACKTPIDRLGNYFQDVRGVGDLCEDCASARFTRGVKEPKPAHEEPWPDFRRLLKKSCHLTHIVIHAETKLGANGVSVRAKCLDCDVTFSMFERAAGK